MLAEEAIQPLPTMLIPREKPFRSFFRGFSPLGVVVRFRIAFAENIHPKALRTTTSEVVLLLGQKKLGTHVVVAFWVARELIFSICHCSLTSFQRCLFAAAAQGLSLLRLILTQI